MHSLQLTPVSLLSLWLHHSVLGSSYSWLDFFVKKLCLFFNILIFQAVKNVLSMSDKELSKQNNVEKFEIREQNKNKTEAKWKYKVSSFQLTRFFMISN